MYTLRDALIWLLAVLGLALALKTWDVKADPLSLQRYAATLGVKAPIKVTAAISLAAKAYGQDEVKMLRIAFIESTLNPKAYNTNHNGSEDVGLFQINTVISKEECEEYNVWSVKGNALCAAKVLSRHKKSGDPYYVGRYHSLTLAKKLEYYRKVQGVKQHEQQCSDSYNYRS